MLDSHGPSPIIDRMMKVKDEITFGPSKPGWRLPPRSPQVLVERFRDMHEYQRERERRGLGPLMPLDMEQASKDVAELVNTGLPVDHWPRWAQVVLAAAIAYRYPRPWRLYPGSPWALNYDYEAHKARMILRLVAPLPLMAHVEEVNEIRAWAERLAAEADWGERCFAEQVRAELPKRAQRRVIFNLDPACRHEEEDDRQAMGATA